MNSEINLQKNRLDLAYQRNLQLLNAVLLVGGGTIVTYFASYIFNPSKFYQYTLLFAVFGIITYLTYQKINEKLKGISNKIKDLGIDN